MDSSSTEAQAAEQAARNLLAQYGDDAEVIAMLRAAEVAAQHDTEALAHWDAVIAHIRDWTEGIAGTSH